MRIFEQATAVWVAVALALYLGGIGVILGLYWRYIWAALALYLGCTGVIFGLHWRYIWAALARPHRSKRTLALPTQRPQQR